MNRRALLASLAGAGAAGLAGCVGTLGVDDEPLPNRPLNPGEGFTTEGLAVELVDAAHYEAIDADVTVPIAAEASVALVRVRIEHVGDGLAVFPHPSRYEVLARRKGERVPIHLATGEIVAGGESYPSYDQAYQDAGADQADPGTVVDGWLPVALGPDAGLDGATVTVVWGSELEVEVSWRASGG